MSAKSSSKGPNYALVAGLGVAGAAAAGAGAHFGAHLGNLEAGLAALAGGILAAGVGLIPSFGSDSKKLAAQISVKKNVDQAYQMQSLGRLDQAEKLLLEAVEKCSLLGETDISSIAAVHSLANLYRLQKKFDRAEDTYRRALKAYEGAGKTEESAFADCLKDFAWTLRSRDNFAESLKQVERALPLAQKLGDQKEVAEITSLLSANRLSLGKHSEAIQSLNQVKQMQIQQYGENSSQVIETLLTTARCYVALQQPNEALESYKDALVRTNKAERPNRTQEAEALLEMAETRLLQGSPPPKDVEPVCLGALKVLQTYVGPREKLLKRIVQAIRQAREKLGQAFPETELLQLFTQNRDQVRDLFRTQEPLIQQKDRTGWGPLQWTLFLGWEDLMRWLLRNEAQANDFEATVMSPIHVAAAWSKGASITFLHEGGVQLDVVGPQGWSPVHYAAYHGRQDCLEQLIARGCEPQRLDQQGRSALHLAAEQGHNDIVAFLLGKSLDKDQQETKYGRSPLHLAAAAAQGSVVRTLMMNGANESLADKQGKTPIDLAETSGAKGLATAMRHFKESNL